MAMRLGFSDTIDVPVAGTIPEAGGRKTDFSFTLTCKRVSAEESKNDRRPVPEFLNDAIQGWSGMQDRSGADLPFDRAALKELLDVFGMESHIFSAYVDAVSVKAKEKNSGR
jgi:hypothetical protein